MKFLPINSLLACIFGLFIFFGCKTDTNTAVSTSSTSIVEPEMVTARIRANPDAFCPYQTFRAWTLTILEYSFQKLLDRDRTTLELIPQLAKEVPTMEPITEGPMAGGYKITYEILEEATWDNGTPITGEDYLTTMKIVFNPAGTKYLPVFKVMLNYYHDIKVDEKNPKKFTIYTNRPHYKLLDESSYFVLPAYAYDPEGVLNNYQFSDFTNPDKSAALKDNADLKSLDSLFSSTQTIRDPKNVIGSGPYQISEWNQKENVTITKKENWWGEKFAGQRQDFTANAKSIRFEIIPDEAAAIALMKNGEIDIVNTISGTSFEELKKNEIVSNQYEFHNPTTLSANFFGLNAKRAKLKDRRVRQAISCLVDRVTLSEEVYKGHATPIYSPIPEKYTYFHADKTYAFNIEKARKLLSEAGWEDTNGNGTRDKVLDGKLTELSFDILTSPSNTVVNQMLLVLQDDFKKAGIAMEQRTLEARERSAARQRGEFDIFTSGAVLSGEIYGIYQFWHTESTGNFFGTGNAKLNELIKEIEGTTDEAELARLFIEFQKQVEEEQYLIFITCPKERMVFNKRLKNHKVNVRRPNYQAGEPHL